MKIKYLLFLLGVVTTLIVIWILFHRGEDHRTAQKVEQNMTLMQLSEIQQQHDSGDLVTKRVTELAREKLSPILLAKAPSEEYIHAQKIVSQEGGSDFGQIKIRGKLVFQGTKDEPLDSYQESPDEKFILVNTSTSAGHAFILDREGNRVMDVPRCPPQMISGRWHWLGNKRIIGYYGPNQLDESDNLIWTKFYIWDLNTKVLSDLVIPQDSEGKRLEIRVLKTGEFELHHEKDEKRQWFSVPD